MDGIRCLPDSGGSRVFGCAGAAEARSHHLRGSTTAQPGLRRALFGHLCPFGAVEAALRGLPAIACVARGGKEPVLRSGFLRRFRRQAVRRGGRAGAPRTSVNVPPGPDEVPVTFLGRRVLSRPGRVREDRGPVGTIGSGRPEENATDLPGRTTAP